jgi:hypothetical protein
MVGSMRGLVSIASGTSDGDGSFMAAQCSFTARVARGCATAHSSPEAHTGGAAIAPAVTAGDTARRSRYGATSVFPHRSRVQQKH